MENPQLPGEQFKMICTPDPKSKLEQLVQSYDKNTVMQFCDCISVQQLNGYGGWITLGMVLKNLTALLETFAERSMKSKTYTQYVCSDVWYKFKTNAYTSATSRDIAKEGDQAKYNILQTIIICIS